MNIARAILLQETKFTKIRKWIEIPTSKLLMKKVLLLDL